MRYLAAMTRNEEALYITMWNYLKDKNKVYNSVRYLKNKNTEHYQLCNKNKQTKTEGGK